MKDSDKVIIDRDKLEELERLASEYMKIKEPLPKKDWFELSVSRYDYDYGFGKTTYTLESSADLNSKAFDMILKDNESLKGEIGRIINVLYKVRNLPFKDRIFGLWGKVEEINRETTV